MIVPSPLRCVIFATWDRGTRAPVEVVESWMIWTSLAALAVNGGITLALMRGHSDLNLRSILVHNFGDALSNIAIIVGAVIMLYTGQHWIDPVLGLAIGLLMAFGLGTVMKGLLVGVGPADPITYVAVSLGLAAVGSAASFVPARRAAKVDPIVALRHD